MECNEWIKRQKDDDEVGDTDDDSGNGVCSCLFRYIRNEMTNCIMLLLDSEGEGMLLLSGSKREKERVL